MAIKIVRYEAKYQKQVADLIISIQRDEFGVEITLEQQPDLLDIENFYLVNQGTFLIALDNHIVVGTIALLDIGNGNGALRKFFVDPNYRGKMSNTAYLLKEGTFHSRLNQ